MNSQRSADVIVIGLGGVGSATVASLAASGYRVVGIDQFAPPHQHGSSHGQTRVIRKAYFEHPNYVPMLLRAYELWRELERQVDKQLYFPVGLLQIGPADGEVIAGVRRSALEHNLDIEQLTMDQALARYPSIHGDSSWTAIIEKDAGYLLVERCVEAHLEMARRYSAQLRTKEVVKSWRPDGTGVSVETDQGTYRAASLVVAAGPWAGRCLQSYALPLKVIRKHVYWYRTTSAIYDADRFPCFFFDTPNGFFYGIPQIEGGGLKLGCHTGGQAADPSLEHEHPVNREDQLAVEQFVRDYMPQVKLELLSWQGCYYTMTPDQHFIVDRLPDHPQVTVVAGLSGHGFKFASVLGDISARLATNRSLQLDISFLSMNR